MVEHGHICPDAVLQHIASTKSLWMSIFVQIPSVSHVAFAALQELLVKQCASKEGVDKTWFNLGMLQEASPAVLLYSLCAAQSRGEDSLK